MKNIVYLSTAVKLLADDVLIEILKVAHKNNTERNVTGVLLYSEGTFIQVLEGEDADVDAIYARISIDLRHKHIIKLIDEPITGRSFGEWAMGFTTVNTDKVSDLLGYLRSVDGLNAKSDNNSAIVTIKTFIESNNLKIRY